MFILLLFLLQIKSYGGVHLFVGGIGQDGHIAFNEPGSSLASRTRIKTLMNDTRIANARFFNGDFNQVKNLFKISDRVHHPLLSAHF